MIKSVFPAILLHSLTSLAFRFPVRGLNHTNIPAETVKSVASGVLACSVVGMEFVCARDGRAFGTRGELSAHDEEEHSEVRTE
jgi:hypothetical protein